MIRRFFFKNDLTIYFVTFGKNEVQEENYVFELKKKSVPITKAQLCGANGALYTIGTAKQSGNTYFYT